MSVVCTTWPGPHSPVGHVSAGAGKSMELLSTCLPLCLLLLSLRHHYPQGCASISKICLGVPKVLGQDIFYISVQALFSALWHFDV